MKSARNPRRGDQTPLPCRASFLSAPDPPTFIDHEGKVRPELTVNDHAIKVKVRANVLEISSVDQIKETFTAIFTLQFRYTDPTLKDFKTKVTYMTEKGCETATGRVVARWGYNKRSTMVLQQDDGHTIELMPTQVIRETEPEWEKEHFQHKWTLLNAVGEATQIVHFRKLDYCSPAGGHIFEKFKFQATFSERLELDDMPFDKQVLRLQFISELFLHQLQYALVA